MRHVSLFASLPVSDLSIWDTGNVSSTNRGDGFAQFTGIGPISDVLAGYMLPGFPIANHCFRLYSSESVAQGLAFLRDFKLGHYMKIAPREMLAVQVHSVSVLVLIFSERMRCMRPYALVYLPKAVKFIYSAEKATLCKILVRFIHKDFEKQKDSLLYV